MYKGEYDISKANSASPFESEWKMLKQEIAGSDYL